MNGCARAVRRLGSVFAIERVEQAGGDLVGGCCCRVGCTGVANASSGVWSAGASRTTSPSMIHCGGGHPSCLLLLACGDSGEFDVAVRSVKTRTVSSRRLNSTAREWSGSASINISSPTGRRRSTSAWGSDRRTRKKVQVGSPIGFGVSAVYVRETGWETHGWRRDWMLVVVSIVVGVVMVVAGVALCIPSTAQRVADDMFAERERMGLPNWRRSQRIAVSAVGLLLILCGLSWMISH